MECELLADQVVIVGEEVQNLKERIAEEFAAGQVSRELIQLLQAKERSYERCLAAIERHAASHQVAPRNNFQLHA
jgi:hypothetical protein